MGDIMICVSDEQIIVNIQGIRFVSWGEANSAYMGSGVGRPYFLSVTYKGNHSTFYYVTEEKARAMYTKIREAMDKEYAKTK